MNWSFLRHSGARAGRASPESITTTGNMDSGPAPRGAFTMCNCTSGNDGSQPPLPSLKTLQVLKALALVAGTAEIELLDVLIVAQLFRAAVEHHLALFHDVAMACHRERGARVLFHEQDRDPGIP